MEKVEYSGADPNISERLGLKLAILAGTWGGGGQCSNECLFSVFKKMFWKTADERGDSRKSVLGIKVLCSRTQPMRS